MEEVSQAKSQKLGILHGENSYDMLAGPGYEQIPVSIYAQGFDAAASDYSQQDAVGDLPQNAPRDTQQLGIGDTSAWQRGYHVPAPEETLAEMGDNFTQFPLPSAGLLGRIMHSNYPRGSMLPGTNVRTRDIGVRMVDPGLSSGLLTDNAMPKYPKQGHRRAPQVVQPEEITWSDPFSVGIGWIVLGVGGIALYFYIKHGKPTSPAAKPIPDLPPPPAYYP